MKIAVASDHRGFHAKEQIKLFLERAGHEVTDFGCHSQESCDYPDVTIPAAEAVAKGQVERGIFLCGTGIGTSIAANKVVGIRAALCHDELTAGLSRRHNDANVLCLAGDLLGDELIRRLVDVWMTTDYEEGRHSRRLGKIGDFERSRC